MAFIRVLFVATALTVLKGQNSILSNDHCVPNLNNCQKGDLIDKSVADCCYVPRFFDIRTCDIGTRVNKLHLTSLLLFTEIALLEKQ